MQRDQSEEPEPLAANGAPTSSNSAVPCVCYVRSGRWTVKQPFRSRLGIATAIAAVAVLVTGGLAVATNNRSTLSAIPGVDGVVHGCVKKGGGVLRIIDPSKGAHCRTNEQALTFNEHGPQGVQGAQGSAGSVGTAGSGQGIEGEPGASGATGQPGPAGGAGATGAAGPAGATGTTGATGPPGPVLGGYVSAYTVNPPGPFFVPSGGSVPFSSTGPINGIIASTFQFQIQTGGTYRVTYSMATFSACPAGFCAFRVSVNGISLAGSDAIASSSTGLDRDLLATFAANDVVTVTNVGPASAALSEDSIVIQRIA